MKKAIITGNVYTEQDRILMAEKYLLYGTCRKVSEHTKYSKSTVHAVITKFIEEGGFYNTHALKEMVEKNKKERAKRGGDALAKKLRTSKIN